MTPPICPDCDGEFIRLAEEAIASEEPVVGVVDGDGLVCVPDLVLLELVAHQLPAPPTFTLRRGDGREVAFFRLPPEGAR